MTMIHDDVMPLPASETGDAPDDVRSFFEAFGITSTYTCMVRQSKPGGGLMTLQSFKNITPTIDQLGKMFGPGDYKISFTWYKAKGEPDGGKTAIQEMDLSLPRIPWERAHLLYMDELRRADDLENDRRSEAELARARVRAAGTGGGESSLAMLQEAAKTLQSLGVSIGGNNGSKPIDWANLLPGIAAVVSVLAPLFKRDDGIKVSDLITMQSQQQQLLISALTNKTPMENQMGAFMQTVLGVASKTMQLTSGKPVVDDDEKESWVDRVFGLIESVGPSVIQALAAKPQAEREKNMLFNMAAGSQEFATLKANPELLAMTVTKLDKAYGYEATDEILSAFEEIGLKRPASTFENAELYPSKQPETSADEEAPTTGAN